jgi:hypothetical protein
MCGFLRLANGRFLQFAGQQRRCGNSPVKCGFARVAQRSGAVAKLTKSLMAWWIPSKSGCGLRFRLNSVLKFAALRPA